MVRDGGFTRCRSRIRGEDRFSRHRTRREHTTVSQTKMGELLMNEVRRLDEKYRKG